uniref:Uncharacterized protein n=1 Tax=Knipowitschia caucasica TaxID=637954 RepID=A0AAV2LYX3_KNICA
MFHHREAAQANRSITERGEERGASRARGGALAAGGLRQQHEWCDPFERAGHLSQSGSGDATVIQEKTPLLVGYLLKWDLPPASSEYPAKTRPKEHRTH